MTKKKPTDCTRCIGHHTHPGEDSWEAGHTDGCKEVIDDFWSTSNKNPATEFIPDPTYKHRYWICGWRAKTENNEEMQRRCLRAHITRKGHKWEKERIHTTARKVAARLQHEERQKELPHDVKWGSKQVSNSWRFKYLGSWFQADGKHIHDLKARIADRPQPGQENSTMSGLHHSPSPLN